MRFNSLKAFRFVMERGTIAAAAERLNLSQPAVSRLISGLEAEVGISLFLRKGRRLIPNQEGLRLFEETQGLLVAIDRVPTIVKEIKEGTQRRIRIVSMPRLASSLALPAIGTVQAGHPQIRCELVVLDRLEMEKWIIDNDFDVGLAVLPINARAVEITHLNTSPIHLLVPHDHPLAKRKSANFAQIADESIIALLGGTRDRSDMDVLFRSHSVKPKIRSEVPTVEQAATLAASGLGIAFADELSVSALKHLNIRIVRLDPTWQMAFGLFRPSHRRLTSATSALIGAIELQLNHIRIPFRNKRV